MDKVEVTQADIDAVAAFHKASFRCLFETTDAEIDEGINRAHGLLCQAFADHRAAHSPDTTAIEALQAQVAARDAEIGRLKEALTPSGDTKAAYMGEFQFNIEFSDEDGNSIWHPHYVPWDVIKDIMKAISARAALGQGEG